MWAVVRQAYIKFSGQFWTAEIPISGELAELMRGTKPKVWIEDGMLLISGKGDYTAHGNTVAGGLLKSSLKFGDAPGFKPAPMDGKDSA